MLSPALGSQPHSLLQASGREIAKLPSQKRPGGQQQIPTWDTEECGVCPQQSSGADEGFGGQVLRGGAEGPGGVLPGEKVQE